MRHRGYLKLVLSWGSGQSECRYCPINPSFGPPALEGATGRHQRAGGFCRVILCKLLQVSASLSPLDLALRAELEDTVLKDRGTHGQKSANCGRHSRE